MNFMGKQITFIVACIAFLYSCNQTARIKTGEDAFDVGQYAVAVQYLEKEFNDATTEGIRSDKAFLMGQAYEKMNDPDKALQWYRMSVKGVNSPNKLIYLAYALKNTGRYQEALNVFDALAKQLNDPNRFQSEVVSLHNANQWEIDAPTNPFKLQLSPFNSEYSDYSPVIRSDGKIIFSSDRKDSEDAANYKWTGNGYSNLFVADSNLSPVTLLPGVVNTEDNEGSLVYSPDGRKMVFCKCFDRIGTDLMCKLMQSVKIGETWADPEVMTFVSDTLNYLGPAFSDDGKVLFFAMEDPQYNTGFDLYYSQLKGEVWQAPVRLPAIINSEYNEKYATIDKDTLYFSSDRPAGMGGLDIYKTYVNRDGWTPPNNMKAPINSPYDDFGMVFDPGFISKDNVLAKGFLSSNRKGGVGQDDIYHFTKIQTITPKPEFDTTAIADKSILVKLIVYVRGFNVKDGKMSNSSVELASPTVTVSSMGKDSVLVGDKYGKVTTLLKVRDNLTITASKDGYLTSSKTINQDVIRIDSSLRIQEFSMILNLYPVLYDQEIVIKDIYYDLDKFEIRKDAVGSLDELLSILKLNPSFKIKINSHTDCRGSNAYNLTLSGKRAQSVVNYLTSNGISRNRLSFQGYGETRPIATCLCEKCSEEEHQLNRRTTFQLVR